MKNIYKLLFELLSISHMSATFYRGQLQEKQPNKFPT